MKETNSLVNLLAGDSAQPAKGVGVTVCGWTDRYPGTITRVSPSGKTFWFREDIATRTDKNGMSEVQEYTFTENPDAPEQVVRLTKRGWRAKGTKITVGARSRYYDFSF